SDTWFQCGPVSSVLVLVVGGAGAALRGYQSWNRPPADGGSASPAGMRASAPRRVFTAARGSPSSSWNSASGSNSVQTSSIDASSCAPASACSSPSMYSPSEANAPNACSGSSSGADGASPSTGSLSASTMFSVAGGAFSSLGAGGGVTSI